MKSSYNADLIVLTLLKKKIHMYMNELEFGVENIK